MGVTAILVTVAGAIFAGLLKTEIEANARGWADGLRKMAVNLSPGRLRARLSEEWAAHLEQVPGPLGKLFAGLGFLFAGSHLSVRSKLRHLSPRIQCRAAIFIVGAMLNWLQAMLWVERVAEQRGLRAGPFLRTLGRPAARAGRLASEVLVSALEQIDEDE